MTLDENSIKSQLSDLFIKADDLKERVVKLEVRQESLIGGHDEHKEKITKHGDLLTKISIGGIVIFIAIEKLGILEKLS